MNSSKDLLIEIKILQEQLRAFKENKEKTQDSEERFKSLFNNINSGMALHELIFDDDGSPIDFIFLDVNSSYEQITNLKVSEIIGKRGKEVIPNLEKKWLDTYAKVAITGDPVCIIDHSNYLDKWWEVKVFSPKKNQFAVNLTDITKNKIAEKTIQAQNLRYSTLLENINGLVYRCKNDSDWAMQFVSNGCFELTGYNPDHLINNKFIAFNDLILTKYQEYVWNEIQQQLKKKDQYEIEYEIITASGEIKWVWERGRGIFDDDKTLQHLEGIISDITQRKHAEEKAKKLSIAVEQSPETIVITNKLGIIEYVNPTFEKLTGYSSSQAIGQNPRILKSGEHSQEYYKNMWGTILAGKTWYGEFKNKKKNGDLYWEKASISPIIDKQNKITHIVAVKEDITKDKELLAELRLAKEKAEESNHLKSAFLANMSHEIRTPMNGILGFADLLKEPNLSGEEQKKYVKVIEHSGRRMLNIINDLIDISKIEAGQMEIAISETNIKDQVEYLSTFFRPEMKKKGLKFIQNFPAIQELLIFRTDREKLYAIITNLLKNAIKYTNEGSIEFGYNFYQDGSSVQTPDRASLPNHKNDRASLQFYIKDTGIGIPANRIDAIFERFIQADIEDRKALEGAGLGLAISKAYVEMLGGRIWVESQENIGSTFYFTIPDHLSEETTNALKNTTSSQDTKANENKLKILVAEDDETSKMHLSIILREIAKEVIYAQTGAEAVEIISQNPDINVVLMDIKMPEMNGYTATRKIREFNKNAIIIAQTAYALAGDREKALEAGCNDYISKPIIRSVLINMLDQYAIKS